jgi:hypothetical protein
MLFSITQKITHDNVNVCFSRSAAEPSISCSMRENKDAREVQETRICTEFYEDSDPRAP